MTFLLVLQGHQCFALLASMAHKTFLISNSRLVALETYPLLSQISQSKPAMRRTAGF